MAKPTPYDTGNTLLAEVPAQMTAVPMSTADGPRLGVTIRTSSATVTVLLSQDDASNWSKVLARGGQGLGSGSGLVLPPPP